MTEPLVHVLVINWNGRGHLEECFNTLVASPYRNVRFILLDNASSDDSVAFVREQFGNDPRVEVLECGGNLGWSRGNNVGLEDALARNADYVLLLNNDTASNPDLLEHLVAMAEEDPGIGALAPKILLYDDPDLLNSVGLDATPIGAAWDIGLGRIDGEWWDEIRPVIGVCGAAWFIRTAVLRKTGLLPVDFDIYLDDLDLCLRIWNAGHTIQTCPAAVVRHKFSATMGQGKQARRKYYLNTRNRMRIIARNYPPSRWPTILPACFLGEARALGRAMLDGEPWRVWSHVKSWGAALAYVPSTFRERRRRKRDGIYQCQFWPLIRTAPLFFPGIEFPELGWYRSCLIDGHRVRPMARRAHYLHEAGQLRLTQLNCYPRLGPLDVSVSLDGRPIAHLQTDGCESMVLDLPRGNVVFEAARIFRADDTGEAIDTGGWIGLEPC